MSKKELIKEEKVSTFDSEKDMHEYVIKNLKAEIDRLSATKSNLSIEIAKFNNMLSDTKSKVEQDIKAKKAQAEKELAENKDFIMKKEYALRVNLSEVESRIAQVEVRESRVLAIENERKAIMNKSIELDKYRSTIWQRESDLSEAIAKNNDISSKCAIQIQKYNDLIERLENKEKELNNSLEKHYNELSLFKSDKANFDILKFGIDAKLVEVNHLAKCAAEDKESAKKMLDDVRAIEMNNSTVFKAIVEREKKVSELERDLKSKEDDYQRKMIMQKVG